MILSKSNLKAIAITVIDKAIPVLNNLHITRDGTTIATNGKVMMAVSPVLPQIKERVPLKEKGKIPREGVTISSETIKEVLKTVPKDSMFNGLLEHTEFKDGVFTINDGKRTTSIESKLYERKYVNYRKVFRSAAKSEGKKIVINRKRLYQALKAIDDICPDSSGESPVFIEFTDNDDILLRAQNYKTGQHVMAVMNTYTGVEGKWPKYNLWESKLLGLVKNLIKRSK